MAFLSSLVFLKFKERVQMLLVLLHVGNYVNFQVLPSHLGNDGEVECPPWCYLESDWTLLPSLTMLIE